MILINARVFPVRETVAQGWRGYVAYVVARVPEGSKVDVALRDFAPLLELRTCERYLGVIRMSARQE